MSVPQRFTKANVDPASSIFKPYRKHRLTDAARIHGRFDVQTREGWLKCEDGYLAIDSGGNPYPIAADEFEAIYEPADPKPDIVPSSFTETNIKPQPIKPMRELERLESIEEYGTVLLEHDPIRKIVVVAGSVTGSLGLIIGTILGMNVG